MMLFVFVGVLSRLSFLEAQSKQKTGAQPQSRVQELKTKVEELKKQRDRLRAEIFVHQVTSEILLSCLLLGIHDFFLFILGGYDVIKTNQDKCLCFSLATAYQGDILETYNIEISVSQPLRIIRHNIPPFIPVMTLAEETDMQKNIRRFLDTLSLHLNAFTMRKQQLKLVKEQHLSVEVLETNALCSLLVLMLTEPNTNTALLCSLDYSDHTRGLPTRVTIQCEGTLDLSGSPQWQKNTALLQNTPVHEALQIMRKTGQII
uniref:Centromere protein O n=1 Tax=Periophthalmus magnuspinnatus TaxID=409849 RepID=A0A3B3Z8J5_9GOBI